MEPLGATGAPSASKATVFQSGLLLSPTPWLAAVPGATLDQLSRHAVLHRVPSGTMLFEQAQEPNFTQFVISGSVELLAVRGTSEMLVELVTAVDMLLPAATINRQPYLARARVLSEAQMLMVQSDAFRAALVEDHAFCLAVLSCQAAQFRRQMKHAKNVKLRSAEERVGCYLRKLIEATPPGETARLPMEKRLIASQLGMTRETFSRTLSAMTAHGLRVSGDIVLVEDALAAEARFPLDAFIDGPEVMVPLPLEGS